MKNIRVFLSENFQILEVKFSIYLNRRVFVMMFACNCYYIILKYKSIMVYSSPFIRVDHYENMPIPLY